MAAFCFRQRINRLSAAIEDYGIIGDGQTAALVNKTGAIDWLCWPRFDSDACFAELLGTDENGRWSIAPVDLAARARRRYQDDTLILETEFETASGTVRLVDFMPIRNGAFSSVVRLVSGLSGSVAMHMDLRIRFDYGALAPWCERHDRGLSAKAGPAQLMFDAPVDITVERGGGRASFTLAEGGSLAFVLSFSASTSPAPPPIDACRALNETKAY